MSEFDEMAFRPNRLHSIVIDYDSGFPPRLELITDQMVFVAGVASPVTHFEITTEDYESGIHPKIDLKITIKLDAIRYSESRLPKIFHPGPPPFRFVH
jgi:hypothetical protein